MLAIDRRFHSLIRRTIEERLSHEPNVESKNRKPLLRPAALDAGWELRFGPGNRFRVFYRVEPGAHAVFVLAVGVKRGNRLYVGGLEFDL